MVGSLLINAVSSDLSTGFLSAFCRLAAVVVSGVVRSEERAFYVKVGDSGEAERLFRRESERHSGMIPNTIGA